MRGGVRRSQNAESSGPGIGKEFQRGVRHHAFEGFTWRELAGDGLGLHALHDGGGVNNFEPALVGRPFERDDCRAGRDVVMAAGGFLRRRKCGPQHRAQQRQPSPEARRAAQSEGDLGGGHEIGGNISLPAETNEFQFHAKDFF